MRFRTLQVLVRTWCVHFLGQQVADDKQERCFRFLEEALETVQAGGITKAQALQLVDYTFSRPAGVVAQEVGQAAITLAALCSVYQDVDLERSVSQEWTRIQQDDVIEKIRRKQATKPKGSSLPGGDKEVSSWAGESFTDLVARDGAEGLPGRWVGASTRVAINAASHSGAMADHEIPVGYREPCPECGHRICNGECM